MPDLRPTLIGPRIIVRPITPADWSGATWMHVVYEILERDFDPDRLFRLP